MPRRTGKHIKIYHADGVWYPAKARKDKVLIVMSGSEGGTEHAEKTCWFLQDHGIPSLALGYFKTKNSGKNLDRIELENVEAAISWLRNQGYEKIGILGASKGAEYAAASSIAFKTLGCVILRTPSWFYSEGMTGRTPSGKSCWSYKGQELPFTPYKTRKLPILKEVLHHREYHILAVNEGKKVVPESVIPIEKIQAPILMFSTKADTIWPSYESCEKLKKRLKDSDYKYPYKHISFEYMSHMMLEYCGKGIKYFIKSERDYPDECVAEREQLGTETIQWIEKIW
ncbi:MAG: acyl-CoA thioester hydrolase/BAAT C-terminal domain-containing protein [Eubacteriales bacterium]|nr:acyl-CoA thioester hydrolase/BAAT C-terminal domain-containing protein [Eubacteriales bacterium]